jgi:hypothetical protein
MLRPFRYALVFALGALLAGGRPASAQLYEDFESYNRGTLDKNDPNGPNQAPNGTGNPWFGPMPPNCVVVGPEGAVMPISGSQMIRGSNIPFDRDQNWFNLAYRLNNGQPFRENVILDWWFYDPLGAGGTALQDYAALAFYNLAPADTDGPPDYDLNSSTQVQRLSLGGTSAQDAGFDANFYQARVVGATGGYNPNGWFNTITPRSIGWHHAAIGVGPLLPDGSNDAAFYIDDLDNPTFMHNVPPLSNFGYNIIEVNANFGPVTGYWDDISFNF